MENFLSKIAEINSVINDFVWVKVGLVLLLGAGLIMTVATRVFTLSHLRHWWRETVMAIFKKDADEKKSSDKKSISQFQSLCAALAGTIGTGNVAGVSAAIVIGGPGAVFWMWVAAFLGMTTKFSENVLGIYYRRKNADGEYSGGPMYYLRDGLGKKKGLKIPATILAILFALFTILASFGIGNMGQVNKITLNMQSAFFKNVNWGTVFGVPTENFLIGIALMILTMLIVIGGLQRIAKVAERVVPFMAILYIIGALVIVGINIENIIPMFRAIFRFALGTKAVAGGAAGFALSQVITQGCKRGVFSNEAGLGSSVMIHSNADVREPVKQGMWGIFEVFFDTIVVCTMTALVVLSSGFIDLSTGALTDATITDATLIAKIFGNHFGIVGEWFVAVAMFLFAFTTVLGWSQYGTKAVEYLFGKKATYCYKVIFVLMIISGAVMTSSLAWDISDTFNGLMMIPNLIGVVALCPLVIKITRNYVRRKIKGENIAPMVSFEDKQA